VFRHNTAVAKVDARKVHNVYEDRTVVHPVSGPNHSFNGRGGPPGLRRRRLGQPANRTGDPAQQAHLINQVQNAFAPTTSCNPRTRGQHQHRPRAKGIFLAAWMSASSPSLITAYWGR
jgi:hypothetical protein